MFEHIYSSTAPTWTHRFQKCVTFEPGAELPNLASDQFNNSRHYFTLFFLSVQFRFSSRAMFTSGMSLIDQQSLLFLLRFIFLEKEEQEVKIAEGVGHILKW